MRDRTRGRGRGHGRQTPIEREEPHRAEEMGEREHVEHATPQATMQEMMAAGFQELRTELQLYLDRQLRSLLGERTVEREEQPLEAQEELEEPIREEPPRENRAREATVVNFMKLKLPVFSRTEEGEDPQDFIQDIERIGDVLKCLGEGLADLAAFQLRRAARI